MKQNQTSREEEKFSQWKESFREPFSGNVPMIQEPKIKTIWMEDQILGRRYIAGHWKYVIEEPTQWQK